MRAAPVFVIVGAGSCGATAAGALRSEGFDGRIVLVGDEPDPPYERPPLSKDFLVGKQSAEGCHVQSLPWYEEHDIELRLGEEVVGLDPTAGAVDLTGGERILCDGVLLVTGGRPRVIPGIPPGDRVFYLRTLADAQRLAARLGATSRLVVVGAGFIGCEVAASARQLGADVVVLELLDAPMGQALPREIGEVFAGIHRDEGVDLRTGEGVLAVGEVSDAAVVETTKGAVLECDAVVVGVGIVANVELAARAGIAVDDGIVVDEHCRTSVANVYAAGDVARHRHPLFGGHLRVEHHDNALKHGVAAAHNLLGHDVAFDDPHWFWSDQYEHNLQSVGVMDSADDVVMRGAFADRSFTVFYLRAGRLRGALALNRGRDVMRARRLIHAGVVVDPAQLRDEDVDLRHLAPRA